MLRDGAQQGQGVLRVARVGCVKVLDSCEVVLLVLGEQVLQEASHLGLLAVTEPEAFEAALLRGCRCVAARLPCRRVHACCSAHPQVQPCVATLLGR